MSDGQNSGIPVYRQISPWAHLPEYIYSANDPKITDEPGRWFPEAEAAALVDVAEATRAWRAELNIESVAYQDASSELGSALDRLDAARGAK